MVVRIGLIGDCSQSVTAHTAIPRALDFAAAHLGCDVRPEWLATDELLTTADSRLAMHHAFWCTPGSPYRSLDGAVRAIRFARESGKAFLGTCGGFQHAVIELARNVLNIPGADHAESNPGAVDTVISPLACSLIEVQGRVQLVPGSRIRDAYGKDHISETYRCSFGLNPAYRKMFDHPTIVCSALAENSEVRAIELKNHPYFVATLFQPERSALKNRSNPLITAFLSAAMQPPPSTGS